MKLFSLIVLLFTSLILGCGGDAKPAPLADDLAITCTPDEALIAETRSCLLDSDCPCGTSCTLGLCEAECRSDADCDVGACNQFGLCTEGKRLIPDLQSEPVGMLQIEPNTVQIAASGLGRLYLRALERDSGRVRIVADEAVLVSCNGTDFASSCLFSNLLADDPVPRRIDVQVAGAVASDVETSQVRVFSTQGYQSVNVALLAPTDVRNAGGCGGGLDAGVYQGIAQLRGVGVRGRLVLDPLPTPAEEVRIPVTARIYGTGESQRIVVSDLEGVIFGDSGATGDTLVRGGTRQVDLVSTGLLSAAGPGGGVDIGVEFVSDSWECSSEKLSGGLRAYYVGATQRGHDPYFSWQLHLSRDRDLGVSDAAPDLPAAWQLGQSVQSRSETAFASEQATRSAVGFDPSNPLTDNSAANRVQSIACNYGKRLINTLSLSGHTGDLQCQPGTEQKIYPLLRTSQLRIDDLMQACLQDLQGTGAGDCVVRGRALLAIAEALSRDRERAFGGQVLADREASALGLRQIQQWIGVAEFVAKEGIEINRLNRVLPSSDQTRQDYTVKAALANSLRASALLFHPRVAVPLLTMRSRVLASPDYRTRLFPTLQLPSDADAAQDQGQGIPVAMLRTTSTQLRTMRTLLIDVQSRRSSLEEARPSFSMTMRQSLITLALANAIYDNARTVGAPSWQPEWENARSELLSVIVSAYQQYELAVTGKNPLGIEKGDLPLYRVGDQMGSLKKFAALSNFLLGTVGSSSAVAPAMLDRADAALTATRSAWVASAQRDLDVEYEVANKERRLAAIAQDYGAKIISYCGDPNWSTATVLDDQPDVDANRCFVAPECKPSMGDSVGSITSAQLGYGLCILSQARAVFGTGISSGDERVDALADDMPASPSPLTIDSANADGSDVAITAHWDGVQHEFMLSHLVQNGDLPPGADPALVEKIETGCQDLRQRSEGLRPGTEVSTCQIAQDCPIGSRCSGGGCVQVSSGGGADTCYRGSLGAMALGLRSAQQDIGVARSKLAEFSEAYDISIRTCLITQRSNQQLSAALLMHNNTMSWLGKVKLYADVAANAAEALRESGGTGGFFFSGGTQTVGAIAYGIAKSASDKIASSMEEVQRGHEELVGSIEASREEAICFNDAELSLVGVRTVGLEVQKAQKDLERMSVEFENSKRDLRRLLREGRIDIAQERDLVRPAIYGNFWIDESITRYESVMRQAKRAVYLAVLAAEYEYQFSSIEKDKTLAANTPGELRVVIDRLLSFTATGTVGGSSPNELSEVLSLRNQLLQIGDRSQFPEDWYDLSDAQRFRLLLSSPRYARYSATGTYLGQQIPFSIAPLSRFSLGSTLGAAILSGTDCAERLWSVNASVLGADLHTGETTKIRLVLKKRNTFFSQWCGTSGPDGSDVQVASTRPSRNLFLDPLAFDESALPEVPVPDPASLDEVQGFSNARIQAHLNLSRADLEDENYSDGDSQELAGRGLYGDYALFFPKEILSIDGGEGLILANVEDVLLRLDYVSVAR